MFRPWLAWLFAATAFVASAQTLVQPEKKLPSGKTVKTYPGPSGKTSLIVHDSNEVGDFVWLRLYLRSPRGLVLLDAYNEVSRVRWSRDGKTVTYRGVKATDADEFTTYDITYALGNKALREKKVKVEKMEGGG